LSSNLRTEASSAEIIAIVILDIWITNIFIGIGRPIACLHVEGDWVVRKVAPLNAIDTFTKVLADMSDGLKVGDSEGNIATVESIVFELSNDIFLKKKMRKREGREEKGDWESLRDLFVDFEGKGGRKSIITIVHKASNGACLVNTIEIIVNSELNEVILLH
jgi:hypothetical protein